MAEHTLGVRSPLPWLCDFRLVTSWGQEETGYLASPFWLSQWEGWPWTADRRDLQKLLNALRCHPSRHLGWLVLCRIRQHVVTLSLELGTLSAAGWLSQPHSATPASQAGPSCQLPARPIVQQ